MSSSATASVARALFAGGAVSAAAVAAAVVDASCKLAVAWGGASFVVVGGTSVSIMALPSSPVTGITLLVASLLEDMA